MNFNKEELELLTDEIFAPIKWQTIGKDFNFGFIKNLKITDLTYQEYLDYSYSYCEYIATGHYENFPISSIILPKKIRKYIFAIYAFSRLGDDIADECNFWQPIEKINKLNIILNNLNILNNSSIEILHKDKFYLNFSPILYALNHTINEFNLDFNLFDRLYKAFIYDSDFNSFDTFDEIYNYCNNSANPIGEILLNLFNEINNEDKTNDKVIIKKSKDLCTALQLINFYQDLSIDKLNKRYYFPKILFENEVEFNFFYENPKLIKKDRLLEILTSFQKEIDILLKNSIDLPKLIQNKRFGLELKMIFNAANKLYKKSKLLDNEIIEKRVKLHKLDYITIIFKSIVY